LELLIPILIILAGLGLILIEVYLIPGFNVVGVVGFLVILFGIGYSYNEVGVVGGTAFMIGSLALTGGVFVWMWKSGAWDRFILATNLRSDERLIARESADRAQYLGQKGVAITPLRPTGIVEIDGRRIEVMTEGEFIAAGSFVSIVAMDRRQFYVRLAPSDEEQSVPGANSA